MILVSSNAQAELIKWYGFDNEEWKEYQSKILHSNFYVTIKLHNLYGTLEDFLHDFSKTYNCEEIGVFFKASTGSFIDEYGKHGEPGKKYANFYFNIVALVLNSSNGDYLAYLFKFHYNDMPAQIKDAVKEANLNNYHKLDGKTRLILHGGFVNIRHPKGYQQMDEASFINTLVPVLDTLRIEKKYYRLATPSHLDPK